MAARLGRRTACSGACRVLAVPRGLRRAAAPSSHAQPLDTPTRQDADAAVPQEADIQALTVGQQLRRQACAAAAVLPLASTSFSTGAQGEIYFGLAKAVDVYLVVLTVRILLSWFRNINWLSEPFNTLRQLTDPYMSMFRGIIPAIGGIDLSPMLGFFLLNFLRGVLISMAV